MELRAVASTEMSAMAAMSHIAQDYQPKTRAWYDKRFVAFEALQSAGRQIR